jgi:hypothetical protein
MARRLRTARCVGGVVPLSATVSIDADTLWTLVRAARGELHRLRVRVGDLGPGGDDPELDQWHQELATAEKDGAGLVMVAHLMRLEALKRELRQRRIMDRKAHASEPLASC